jgi:predicted nucleotidyltransferase component of viral defense system
MDEIAKLPKRQRNQLFQETAARKGMTPNVVEKDFWLCWVLNKIFSTPSIAEKIMFKGGTSLSIILIAKIH